MVGLTFFLACLAAAAAVDRRQATSSPSAASSASSLRGSSAVPVPSDVFQTTPEIFAGPTPTGTPAFLAQTNPAPFHGVSYIAPQPLETQVPIMNAPIGGGGNIFELHGQLSHYFSNPTGFGVDEYPLPRGANISQFHMLSRHGSRYPTATPTFAQKVLNNTGKFKASGALSFLNTWRYQLGEQILVPVGKQELFDSGTLHQYLYGHLYPNNGTKLLARTTTQDRMRQSAEYFLAGFFGLHWPDNATLINVIEQNNFNNSLAGYFQCPNSNNFRSTYGTNASIYWQNIYLADAAQRLNKLIQPAGFLKVSDVYDMQSLCAYETVGLGYSAFCPLFTYEEWQGYEYSVDLSFAGNDGFSSPTGRAVGAGWVAELRARLMHQFIHSSIAQVNVTVDNNPGTFPINQSLYFDFSHDTNIMSILTALGIKQFNATLPNNTIPAERDLIVSHLTPFGARLDIEVIDSPGPVPARRPNRAPAAYASDPEQALIMPANVTYTSTTKTQYIHLLLNQRTLPLGRSYPECGARDDGWCELGTFLNVTANFLELANYEYACFANYTIGPYGSVTNGAPVNASASTSSNTTRLAKRGMRNSKGQLKPALLL